MNPKLKLSLIAVIGVALIVLVLTLVQSPGQNVPAPGTPPQPGISNGTPTSPTATMPAVVAGATGQPTSSSATLTPAPEPTMTAEEQKVMEDVKRLNPQSQASSPDQCPTILQTQTWCSLIKFARRITRPEWDELFPQTQFFVAEYALLGREGGQLKHLLVAEQNGQRYDAATFDHLLSANNVVITDANRELIAKSFVLMTLGDYLEQEIVFSDWIQGDWPASFGDRFSYSIKVWTKMQGLRMTYFFAFANGNI